MVEIDKIGLSREIQLVYKKAPDSRRVAIEAGRFWLVIIPPSIGSPTINLWCTSHDSVWSMHVCYAGREWEEMQKTRNEGSVVLAEWAGQCCCAQHRDTEHDSRHTHTKSRRRVCENARYDRANASSSKHLLRVSQVVVFLFWKVTLYPIV